MTDKPQLLVYVRDYFWEIYHDMFVGVDLYQITVVTDFAGRGVAAINPDFHRHLAAGALPPTGLNEDEIIRRCRLLRNLPRARAEWMLRAMHATLRPLVYGGTWTAVMGQTVDDYVTHLLSLLAEERGLPCIGFCSSYFPGYTQVTVSWGGACATGRVADSEESQAVLARISGDRFRQDYDNIAVYDFSVHVKRIGRYWVKRVYFELARRFHRAPHHVHYLLQPFLAQQKRLGDYPAKDTFHPDWEQRLAASTRPVIYIPLGYTPECSTDYMIGDMRFIDYEQTIVRIAEVLGRDLTVLVKDHFHMQGIRRLAFYDRLRGVPGVILVPPGVNSNALLAKGVKNVLSGGGSVGIEATIRGKNVFSFSDTIYWMPGSEARYMVLDELDKWAEQIVTFPARPPVPEAYVRRCLGYMMPFDFMKVGPHGGRKGRELQAFVRHFVEHRRIAPAPV
jgi:hypothetical protein